jgi:hypothetical protein
MLRGLTRTEIERELKLVMAVQRASIGRAVKRGIDGLWGSGGTSAAEGEMNKRASPKKCPEPPPPSLSESEPLLPYFSESYDSSRILWMASNISSSPLAN